MSRIVIILIAVVAVLLTAVVCYVLRAPIKRTCSCVWKFVASLPSKVNALLKRIFTRKQKKLVKCTCGNSHLA